MPRHVNSRSVLVVVFSKGQKFREVSVFIYLLIRDIVARYQFWTRLFSRPLPDLPSPYDKTYPTRDKSTLSFNCGLDLVLLSFGASLGSFVARSVVLLAYIPRILVE